MIYEDAIKLIEQLNIVALKVLDTNGKRLFDIKEDTFKALVDKVNVWKPTLMQYGRVKFMAATESIFKQNWKDAYQWDITFNGNTDSVQTSNNFMGAVPSGYISIQQAMLMSELEKVKAQSELDKKFSDLEKKLQTNQGWEKYLPMLGMFIDLDEKKLNNMAALCQMNGMMNGSATLPTQNAAGVAGLNDVKVQGTPAEKEKIEQLEKNLEDLSNSIGVDKLAELVKLLNEKPQYADMALNFAKASAK